MLTPNRCAVLTVGILGCGATATETRAPPTTAAPAGEPGLTMRLPRLRIVDAKLGEERSARSEPLVLPFGPNQNGTELVYALLAQAGEKGAAAVGELTLYATFRWKGAPVECRQRILLEGDPRLTSSKDAVALAPPGRYDTQVQGYQPQAVELIAEDRELECRTVEVPVTRTRRVENASPRSAEHGKSIDRASNDREVSTRTEKRDECRWRSLTRRTTRYDYEVKLGFVPPDWEHLSQRFARRALVAATPQCYTLAEEELAAQPPYRLAATAYHRGQIAPGAPRSLPSRQQVDSQFAPTHMSPKNCEKILKGATQKKGNFGRPLPRPEGELFEQCQAAAQGANTERQHARILDDEAEDRYVDDEGEIPPFDAD